MKRAVFPGSFDPVTIGHEAIIRAGAELFDEVIVGLGTNTTKKYYFSADQRLKALNSVFANDQRIRVEQFEGLSVDFCRSVGASFILRGLRNSSDYNYENSIAIMNRSLNQDIETVFLNCRPEHSGISSTIVREIAKNEGNYKQFIPNAAHAIL